MTLTMKPTASESCRRADGQQGSALILAALVTVILSLLGLSYLMMAQTESTIAENERNQAAALYVAQAGARLAVNWFNDPTATGYLVPTTAQVDRTKRVYDNDLNTATARVLGVASNAAKPIYKDGSFTASGIFDRPYRSALADTFMGVETGTDPDPNFADKGPDVIVNADYLTTLSDTLFNNYPSPTLRARLTRMEFYSPPLVNIGGNLTRMGVATVKVTAGVFQYPGTASERQIATRIVKAVVNEVPIPGPIGPLQSCQTIGMNGDFMINWGAGTSIGNAFVPSNLDKMSSGLPYASNDPFTYINGGSTLASWATAHNTQSIEDPWYKFISGGTIDQAAPSTAVQPWPYNAASAINVDHSNLFQNTVVNCPTFDYAMWKSIAQSGLRSNNYYKWVAADTFSLDGTGTAQTFESITNNTGGIFFFDTQDGLAPNAPGTNLTPDINLSGGSWGAMGFIYLNANNFGTTGLGGINRTIFPPGEPGDGSGFVNLQYPSSLTGAYTISQTTAHLQVFQDTDGTYYCTDASECDTIARTQALAPVQDANGLPFIAPVVIDGVFYTSGVFTAQGNAEYYGSVIGNRGVVHGAGNPNFYFDERLIKGQWPPKGMNVPRVVVTSWQTDL